MARYRATIKGQRGEASRLGSTKSGLRVTANGWSVGVTVETERDAYADEPDRFSVYMTSGSNGASTKHFIGSVFAGPCGPRFIPVLNADEEFAQ